MKVLSADCGEKTWRFERVTCPEMSGDRNTSEKEKNYIFYISYKRGGTNHE